MYTIQVLKEVCDELGIEYRSYSGRGMSGKQCFAIVADNAFAAVIDIAYAFGERGEDPYGLENVRSDSMGYDTVVYWPQVEWAETEETEDESEDEETES